MATNPDLLQNQTNFDIFSETTDDNIKLGYISPDRGYIEGLSVIEANRYAQENPGTQFIFRNRDKIRYLNINEVNALTIDDLTPARSASDGCTPVIGLREKDIQSVEQGDPTKVLVNSIDGPIVVSSGAGANLSPDDLAKYAVRLNIVGGGGVGARANPVIGRDGSLLAAHLVSGGFGYQYAPQVQIIDDEEIGKGATARAIIGSAVPFVENFQSENDFEEYKTDGLGFGEAASNWGRRFDPNGLDIGEWNPNTYLRPERNPIKKEIQEYQRFLANLTNPWWDTRKEAPLSVTGKDKKDRVVYDVVHPAWGERNTDKKIPDSFMNKYAISPVPMSNAKGSDFAGVNYTMEWEEDFPYDGQYVFRGTSDNEGKLYLDNEYVMDMEGFRSNPKKFPKQIESGVHRIRLDLYNIPQYEKKSFTVPTQDDDTNLIPVEFEIYGQGSKKNMSLKFVFTSADGKHSFTINNVSRSKSTKKQTVKLKANTDYRVVAVSTSTDPGEKTYPIRTEGESSTAGRRVVDGGKEVQFDDDATNGFDENASLKIQSTSPGVTAKFNGDGTELIVKGNGDVSLRFKWNDNPKTSGLSVGTLKVGSGEKVSATFRQSGEKGREVKTIKVGSGEGSKLVPEQGTSRIFGRGKRGTESNAPGQIIFADVIGSLNDNDDIQVKATEGIFTPSNKRKRSGTGGKGKQTRNTWDLTYRVEKNNVNNDRPKGTSNETDVKTRLVFNTLNFISKADRKLWRINPKAGAGSDFANRFGVLPFNPRQKTKSKKVVKRSDPKARIITRNNKLFLVVSGEGKIRIDFKLNVDDSLTTSGLAVRDLKIESADGSITLKRDIKDINLGRGQNRLVGKEREKIKGSAIFEAGREYPITVIGGSQTSGFKSIDKTTVGFDDDISNGYDQNGLLKIVSIKNVGKTETVVKESDPKSSDDYDGVHVIRWESINFPVDGNYNIEILSDDDCKIFIGNRSGNGKMGIGNGLRNVERGGDEVIIEKLNRTQKDLRTKKVETKFFKKGTYRIRVELTQRPGAPLNAGNPMYIAMNIETATVERRVQSARSWNQNPMGVALSIQAPLPPIPQEPLPEQEGSCPRIPFWTTRFPNGKEKWWPVTFNTKAWSKFTNRYAISPIPPLGLNGTDGAGIAYVNEWDIQVDQPGYYGLKGTVDNGGAIYIDNQVVLSGGVGYDVSKPVPLHGFRENKPNTKKIFLSSGLHKIKVEVKNAPQFDRQAIRKKIFSTTDWSKPITKGPGTPAEISVEYRGLNQGSTRTVSGEKSYAIRTEGESRTAGRRVRNNGKEIQFDDDATNGFDENASLKIESTSPGVSAKFNGDGTQLIVKGRGNVSLKFEWDDNPRTSGLAVGTLKVGNGEQVSWTSRQKGEKGSDSKTINVGSKNTQEVIGKGGYKVEGNNVRMKDGHGDDINSTFSIVNSTNKARFSSDGTKINYEGSGEITLRLKWDDDPKTAGKAVDSITVGGKVWNQRGEKNSITQTIKVTAESNLKGGVESGKIIDGVTYTGPKLATYVKDEKGNPALSPFFDEGIDERVEIQGTTWKMTWKNVDFPFNGRYVIRALADDRVVVKINGLQVAESNVRQGFREFGYTGTPGKKTVEIELTNVRIVRPNGTLSSFRTNPTYATVNILYNDTISVQGDRPWTGNPIGISAILSPPPCRKIIEGDGVVVDIIPSNPGNGYKIPETPTGSTGTYPVTTILTSIIIEDGGINHNCGVDVIEVVPSNGISLNYECDSFGKIKKVNIVQPPIPPVFVTTPEIKITTSTGINFKAIPGLTPIPVPEDVLDDDQIIQVTDLVGLKQTGYVNGKPYYGSVFYKDGISYSGIYETLGTLVQVYATLQESIDSQVTTRPSAILRQGTDISSNDPRLNIPGTPENLS